MKFSDLNKDEIDKHILCRIVEMWRVREGFNGKYVWRWKNVIKADKDSRDMVGRGHILIISVQKPNIL